MSGKKYRISNLDDIDILEAATQQLQKNEGNISSEFSSPIPDELIPTPTNKEYKLGDYYWRDAKTVLYGMTRWRDLFNDRQMLSMITFTEKIKLAYKEMIHSGYDEAYAKAVSTYLGVMLDRLADKNSNLVRYNVTRENIECVFGRQALSMIWDYVELNPFADAGWKNMQDWVLRVIEHCSFIDRPSTVTQMSAMSLQYDDGYFDAVFTDPPYYDNIQYSILSDFFYVWLKRSVGYLYPELFSTPLTPKSNEVITDLSLTRSGKNVTNKPVLKTKSKNDFEQMLSSSFKEVHRVLKHNGIAVIVYAYKSTGGWETLINSVLESGLVITAAWPIYNQMRSRVIAKETAALNSSIYMVARKIKRRDLGFYRDIKNDMATHIDKKLTQLWGQGIQGADFFISAIGISLEIFGQYKKIVDDNDHPVTATHLLDDIRKIVTDFAINQVLHSDFNDSISSTTRFYLLWRWAYGHAKMPFDDALKLSHSVGLDLDREYGNGLVCKDKDTIRVAGPTERNVDDIGSVEMVDVLHKSALLWKDNKRDAMLAEMNKSGWGGSDVFYRVAQAITESNPGSEESRLLDGFLSARDGIQDHMLSLKQGQTTLV